MFCLYTFPLARPAQAKIQNLTVICCIVKLIPWNVVNLSHLYKKILHNHFPNIITNLCLGLQAWVSLNPNTNQLYQPIAIPYTIGVTRKNDYMDQTTTVFQVKPGHHISIYVSPKVISSSSTFNSLSLKTRKCKLEDEIIGFSFITKVWIF